MNTIRVGELTVQERNAVVPDGAKVWIVGHPDRGIMFSAGSKPAAITWAKEYQEGESHDDLLAGRGDKNI